MRNLFALVLVITGLILCSCANDKSSLKAEETAATQKEPEGVKVEAAVNLETLRKKIKRYKKITINFDRSRFDEQGLKTVDLLVQASKVMDELFWHKVSSIGPQLRKSLAEPVSETDKLLAHYLAINYGPYDRLDNMEPFIKVSDRFSGATFYPADMTKQEFAKWIETHPQDKKSFQNWFSIIERKGDSLVAVPYSSYYKTRLVEAARLLKEAAELVGNKSFKKFLLSRADAFLSNEYTQSDIDWMDVQDSDLEATIGPYEVYEDNLFNYKAAFESFITLRDPIQSKNLAKIGGYITQLEKNLPILDQYKNFNRGQKSPIVVADLIYSAGDTRAGVQTLAFNLPNDETVRELKGSKKVMLKNISRAKFDNILKPIAGVVLAENQRQYLSFDAYFNHTLMHEMSHGLGPGRIMHKGEKVPVNLVLRELYSTIEEAKADVLGVYNTFFMIEKGELPASMQNQCLVTFLAGVFRSVRFGAHEAHGRANLIAFNYLIEKGAYKFDAEAKCYSVDLTAAPAAFKDLATDILMLQALGDYSGTKDFIEKYASIGSDMQMLLDSLGD
ncbi:MAG: peptidase, partial [Deltaproteobacteria bacterium]|nr:peptidase [Deltaproteobacteria bacterium]